MPDDRNSAATKFIALLRGVNVGGKVLKMNELVEVLALKKYKNIKTYIQSGNIIFDLHNIKTEQLSKNIEDLINVAFGISVSVIIRTEKDFKAVIKNNPLIKITDNDINKLHVTFLKEEPLPSTLLALENLMYENERYEINGKEIYLYCPNGYGRTKLNNVNIERKLKTIATTRNWKTTLKLYELSQT